jgi:hypothetical protein
METNIKENSEIVDLQFFKSLERVTETISKTFAQNVTETVSKTFAQNVMEKNNSRTSALA